MAYLDSQAKELLQLATRHIWPTDTTAWGTGEEGAGGVAAGYGLKSQLGLDRRVLGGAHLALQRRVVLKLLQQAIAGRGPGPHGSLMAVADPGGSDQVVPWSTETEGAGGGLGFEGGGGGRQLFGLEQADSVLGLLGAPQGSRTESLGGGVSAVVRRRCIVLEVDTVGSGAARGGAGAGREGQEPEREV